MSDPTAPFKEDGIRAEARRSANRRDKFQRGGLDEMLENCHDYDAGHEINELEEAPFIAQGKSETG